MCSVPSRVVELIETFDRDIEAYHSQQYNETQLRREFIDPFFEEFGWDVTNKAGNAQAYKDVIHEDAIKVGGATKAPDYCFRIGGVRKFFLEAKKPSVNIKDDPDPAYQLRRYAWSAKLPLSILTDFEEFAVYDCQIRPKHTDKADTARIIYFTYKDYPENWNKIANIFSKDAILKGSFDKFAVATKGKRGTTTVDNEFLEEIKKWRDELARIIALRNRDLSTHEVNFAVQRTIDRIIFLRMCEDRGIEPYSQLQSVSGGDRTYPRLCEIFEKADQKYNSGLFHFHDEPGRPEGPDELTLNLVCPDNPLKFILHSLYYPQCPYEFSVLPPEILGNVYEQFLGSVIQVSPGRRVKVVPKPEVKKAGGVYYTPSYIVDYIVKNTVGKLIEGKTPRQIANIKILDPACGSGSFLLGAYTYLLNYHRDWYVDNDPQKYTKKNYQGKGGQWYLTNAEKKRILLNNIFGVDIDSQAVEVTKLSLLLKVLEGEDAQTLENQYRLFHERALPDLANNIKCGNSLIGPDFFENLEGWQPQAKLGDGHSLIPNDLYQKINPFDWQAEFPQIFSRKAPGFDIVIGNPPYVSFYSKQSHGDEYLVTLVNYWRRAYAFIEDKTKLGRYNTLMFFLEKSMHLLISNGLLHMIIDTNFYSNPAIPIRKYLLNNYQFVEIVTDFRAFTNVGSSQVIILLKKHPAKDSITWKTITSEKFIQIGKQKQDEYCTGSFELYPPKAKTEKAFIEKIRIYPSFDDLLGKPQIRTCITFTGQKDKFILREPTKPNHYPLIEGSKGVRFAYCPPIYTSFVNYDLNLRDRLNEKYRKLAKKRGKRTPMVIGLGDIEAFNSPKIFLRLSDVRLTATYSEELFCADLSLYIITLPNKEKNWEGYNLKYFLGLINSSLYTAFARLTGIIRNLTTGTPQIRLKDVRLLPIRSIDFDNPNDVAKHDNMVQLVDWMLDLHKKLAAAKIPDDKTQIQRRIATTDKQIDNLVYQLYNLTEEEIKIVEESA
ncbi:MAG: Eco57I restriction-modification methylase domain-containing protein [Phycisphaerae bacterium]